MNSVQTHYERHLGPVYTWLVGGFDSATRRGSAELDAITAGIREHETAVDLGAGFGMHSIPLARRGFNVLAVDSCQALLDELRTHKGQLPIQIADDDLHLFAKHLSAPPRLVLCMNDTLTHLADTKAVLNLIQSVSEQLTQGGRFIATFRDYSIPLEAEERFIPVRSDPDRVLSCFLEYSESHLTVNDILYEWNGDMRISVEFTMLRAKRLC